MIKRIVLFLSILFPSLCAAQGAGFQSVLLGPTGRPLAGAQVTVCASTATGLPCTPTSSIFSDPALSQPISNPIITDSLGNWGFWAAPGNYQYSVTGNGVTPAGVPTCVAGKACPYLINISCVVNVSCLTTPTTANIVINSPGSLTVNGTTTTTGTGTHSGTETFNAAMNANAGGTLAGTFGGNRTDTGNVTESGNMTATAGQNSLNFYQFALGAALYWDGVKYPYTTTGLQQILSDCLATSVCEQVHLETAGIQSIAVSSSIVFGSTSKSITVFLSRSTNWNVSITNNTDVWGVHAGTSVLPIGDGTVPIIATQGMTFASNASISAAVRIIDQDGSNNVGGVFEGLTIIPNATMTVSDAILSVQNPLQLHTIRHVSFGGGAWPAGVIGAKVFCTTGKGCGNVSFENVQFDTAGSGKPVWIGCASVGSITLVSCSQTPMVSFSGAATVLVHPAASTPIVDIEQGNGAGGVNPSLGVFFDHPQLESSHNTDIGILCSGCSGLTVNGLGASAIVSGADLIKLAQPAGTVVDGINLTGITNQGLWTNTVNNTIISDTIPGASSCGNGCSYHYHKNFSATATEVWADGTGRIATKGQNGFLFTRTTRGNLYLSDQGSVCTNGELALSAGWQSTGSATVTAVAGNGQTCSWTITTGTTTAANPTITDTLTNALPAATTVCWMNIYGGTHTAVAGESLRQTTLSATAPVFTANFIPTAGGTTYFVTRSCGP